MSHSLYWQTECLDWPKFLLYLISFWFVEHEHLCGFLFFVVFDEPEDPSNRSFFSEIIASISDVKFSYNGRYMLSRDYLTVKVWDVNMESKPVETYPVHEHLRSRLCSLYENDSIFDKFECGWNGTDSYPFEVKC